MRKDFLSRLLRFLVWAAAIITMSLLILLVGYILINGIPHLKASLFDLNYTSDNVSMLPSIINTVLMTIISLLIAAPIGICSAIYLVEYAKRGNKLVEVVRITAETLSGIPSIVYGLFGAIFFVTVLGWGLSLLSGAFTMAIMILPLIMRTTEEALKSVPDSYREGSFGLGRRTPSYHFPCGVAVGSTGHPLRCYPGDRPCGRRDGCADLHRRNRGEATRRVYCPPRELFRYTCIHWQMKDFM